MKAVPGLAGLGAMLGGGGSAVPLVDKRVVLAGRVALRGDEVDAEEGRAHPGEEPGALLVRKVVEIVVV